MNRRKIRPLIIGKDGSGKSALAATFPKLMWVHLFDPPDKAGVYLARGEAGDLEAGKYCYFQDVHSEKDGSTIIRIEYWGESNPNEPKSYLRYIGRMAAFERELIESKVQTAVFDSVTHFELATRFCSENSVQKFNQDGELTRDPRKHYGYSAHAIEQFVMTRWPNLIMCNAIMIGHPGELEREDGDDGEVVMSVRTVEVPGKIATKIGTSYNEVWRVYIDGKGNRRVQTRQRPNLPYSCKTSVGFIDGTYPHYDALWASLTSSEDNAKIVHSENPRTETKG